MYSARSRPNPDHQSVSPAPNPVPARRPAAIPIRPLVRVVPLATCLLMLLTGFSSASTSSAVTSGVVPTTPSSAASRASLGPRPTYGTTIWTTSTKSLSQEMRSQTRLYGKLPLVRLFYPGMPASWSTIRSVVGRTPLVVSFKADPSTVVSGRLDGQLLRWFRSAPASVRTRWSYWHEPEDDIAAGRFSAATYRAAWRHLAALSDRAHNPALRSTLILMGWTLTAQSHRNWRNYYPGGAAVDVLGFDCYSLVANRYQSPSELFSAADRLALRLGKPWGVAELGSQLIRGDRGAGRAKWLHATARYLRAHRAKFTTYFDSDQSGDYILHDAASRTAWRSIVQAG